MVKFIHWDGRPALLGKTEAKALLKPNAKEWVDVDVQDVRHTGGLMDEASWHKSYDYFGPAMQKLPKVN